MRRDHDISPAPQGMGWLSPIMAAMRQNIGSVFFGMASANPAIYPDHSGFRINLI
jgi:hypothetical protein